MVCTRSNHPWVRLGLAIAVICGTALVATAAPPLYVVEDLGTVGGDNGMALGMNDYGVIVGWSENVRPGAQAATMWRDTGSEVFTISLGTLGGMWSEARAVNNHRQIVGVSETKTGDVHAFYYYEDTLWDLTDIVEPALVEDDSGCQSMLTAVVDANEVSDRSWIVGAAEFEGDEGTHAILIRPKFGFAPRQPQFEYVYLGTLPRTTPTGVAYGINEHDLIVGTFGAWPFVWADGEMDALQWGAGQAYAINNLGIAIGCSGHGQPHACMWIEGERVELDRPEGWMSEAIALNDANQIIGYAADGFNTFPYNWQVMIWDDTGAGWDLAARAYVPLGDDGLAGFELSRVTDINKRSEIVGFGRDADGRTRAVRLMPMTLDQ